MVFVIHPSVHLRTRSIDFLLDLLSAEEVRCFQDDKWKVHQDFPCATHMVFHQLFPDLMDVRFLKGKNVTLVPMYDAVREMRDSQWWEYRQFKTVSFCEALTERLKNLGMDVFPMKYFPPVVTQRRSSNNGPLRVFFWRRGLRPDLSMVAGLLPTDVPIELFYRSYAGDSTPALPSFIQVIPLPWFPSRKEYLAAVSSCDLYVSPRESEGVGLSFLEALSCGIPVLAVDAPTMNEYVLHGNNGFLIGRPMPVLSKPLLSHMRNEVLGAAQRARSRFEAEIPAFLEYLLQKPGPEPTRRHPALETLIFARRLGRNTKAAVRSILKSVQAE